MDLPAGTSRRFDVELFIVHPTLDPAEITAALGLEPKVTHPVGERRQAPNGTLLPGQYRDTRWRHSVRYEVKHQHFADAVAALLDRLEPHNAFLRNLRSTGGEACVIIQFLGDGYFGDKLPKKTLAQLADLDLDFAIECFSVPQSSAALSALRSVGYGVAPYSAHAWGMYRRLYLPSSLRRPCLRSHRAIESYHSSNDFTS